MPGRRGWGPLQSSVMGFLVFLSMFCISLDPWDEFTSSAPMLIMSSDKQDEACRLGFSLSHTTSVPLRKSLWLPQRKRVTSNLVEVINGRQAPIPRLGLD